MKLPQKKAIRVADVAPETKQLRHFKSSIGTLYSYSKQFCPTLNTRGELQKVTLEKRFATKLDYCSILLVVVAP